MELFDFFLMSDLGDEAVTSMKTCIYSRTGTSTVMERQYLSALQKIQEEMIWS